MGIRYNKQLIKKDRAVASHGPRDLQNRQLSSGGNEALIASLQERIVALSEQLNKAPAGNTAGLYTAEQVNAEIGKAISAETSKLRLDFERQINDLNVEKINLGNELEKYKTACESLRQDVRVATRTAEERADRINNELKAKYDDLLEQRDNRIKALKEQHAAEITTLKERITSQEQIIAAGSGSAGGISEDKLVSLLAEATSKIEELTKRAAYVEGQEIESDRPKMETAFVDPLESNANELEHKIIVEDVSFSRKEAMADKVNKLKGLMGSLPSKRPV
jgi:Zn finger protein HypA/HybF involved in hydrogenase expression